MMIRSWSIKRLPSSMMEFGALHCTARKPHCEACPLGATCSARQKIVDALAGLPRGTKKESGYRYEDSNRYYGGRVLARLRDASEEGIELRSLGAKVHEGVTDEDVPWIYGVVRSLEKDGLAIISEKRLADAADAVAEERARYDAEEDHVPKGIHIRLP